MQRTLVQKNFIVVIRILPFNSAMIQTKLNKDEMFSHK